MIEVGQVPARIVKLVAEKRYYAAVQLHLQSIKILDREGIQSVSIVTRWLLACSHEMW